MSQWKEDNNSQWAESNLDQWVQEEATSPVVLNNVGAFFNYNTGVSTVWANNSKVFFGTFDDGVKYLNKVDISISDSVPVDLTSIIHDYDDYYLTSKSIRYIHGNGDFMVVCTAAGIDVIKMGSHSYRSFTQTPAARKCFMTSTGKFYYTTCDLNGWSVNMVNSYFFNWTTPDYSWTTGSGVLNSGLTINDIFVTEGTASDELSDTLFVATTSGVWVIDTSNNDHDIYYTTTVSGS